MKCETIIISLSDTFRCKFIVKVIIGNKVVAATFWETCVQVKNILRTQKECLRLSVILLLLMDLPCLQWQDHVAQKWIGLETEQREQFISLDEIDDVFNYARALIT